MIYDDYIVYDSTTGEIIGLVNTVSTDIAAIAGSNSYVIGTVPAGDWYVDVGTPTTLLPKDLFSTANSWSSTSVTANGTSTITYGSSLPNPTTVDILGPGGTINIAGAQVTTGTLTLSVNKTGPYSVTFSAPLYVTETFTITGI